MLLILLCRHLCIPNFLQTFQRFRNTYANSFKHSQL
jgi:hypothetical protein